jgi:hypothetical protein
VHHSLCIIDADPFSEALTLSPSLSLSLSLSFSPALFLLPPPEHGALLLGVNDVICVGEYNFSSISRIMYKELLTDIVDAEITNLSNNGRHLDYQS